MVQPLFSARAATGRRFGDLLVTAAILLLSGCSERQAAATAPPPPAAAPASPNPSAAATTAVAAPSPAPPAAPRATWTLMVTWMSPQQPASTSQTIFHDADACEKARQAALAEGARLQTEAQAANTAAETRYQSGQRRYVGHTLLAGDAEPTPQSAPTVAAFCASS